MAVSQTDVNTLMTAVQGDGTKTSAQKAFAQTLLYSLSKALFGPSAVVPYTGYTNDAPQA